MRDFFYVAVAVANSTPSITHRRVKNKDAVVLDKKACNDLVFALLQCDTCSRDDFAGLVEELIDESTSMYETADCGGRFQTLCRFV